MCKIYELVQFRLNAQTLTNFIQDEFLEAITSSIQRSRISLFFANEKSNANLAREEFLASDYVY